MAGWAKVQYVGIVIWQTLKGGLAHDARHDPSVSGGVRPASIMKEYDMKLAAIMLGAALVLAPTLPAGAYIYHGHHYPYRWHGHYYRYSWHGGYYNHRYHCRPGWCYR